MDIRINLTADEVLQAVVEYVKKEHQLGRVVRNIVVGGDSAWDWELLKIDPRKVIIDADDGSATVLIPHFNRSPV